jgi:hypothetical protein
MNFKALLGSVVLAGAMAFAPVVASAVTLTMNTQGTTVFGSNGYSGATILETTLRPTGVNVNAGGFALNGNLTGTGTQNFTAWCLDIATALRLPSTYTTTNTPFSGSTINSTRLSMIERLFETAYKTLNLASAAQSAGFQLALWELTYENSSYDLSSGNFRVSNSSAAIAAGQAFLAGLSGPITQDYNLTFLQSNDTRTWGGHYSQNLVTVAPIPLPAGGLLLLGALGGLTYLRRRKA